MSISTTEIQQVARLAKLALDEREIAGLARDLGSILDHMRELSAVDTDQVEPMRGVSGHPAPLRPDLVGADPLAIPLAELAPQSEQGFFVVPRLAALDGDAPAAERSRS